MDKKTDILYYLWQIGWFKEYRSPKEISEKINEDFGIYCPNITPILKLKKFKKILKRFKQGWKEIKSANPKGIKKDQSFNEIKEAIGDAFQKEMEELEVVFNTCSNSTAFLLRKILEKLLFIVISKSNKKNKIDVMKQKLDRLPNLTELLNMAKSAEIGNIHILSPKNIKNISGCKFLGDTSAHDYLTSVSFEDIKPELPYWRIAIKELASYL